MNPCTNSEVQKHAVIERKQLPPKEEISGRLGLVLISKRFRPGEVFGGAENFITRLASRLADYGVDITVLSAAMEKSWSRMEEKTSGDGGKLLIHRLPHPRVRFIGTLLYNLFLFHRLVRMKKDKTVVHVNFASKELITAALARMFTRNPLICRIACSGKTGEIYTESKRFYSPLYKRILLNVDLFIALSAEIAKELAEEGVRKESIIRIPNGVDMEEFRPPLPEKRDEARKKFGLARGEFTVCFVGRLSRQKNLTVLLKAFSQLKGRVRMLIAGRGPEEAPLKQLARGLRIDEKVSFLGALKDVKDIYSASDTFVLPSLYEGLSNSLLEAMAQGLPCIATSVSGSNEVIDHGRNGFLVPPGNVKPLAEALNLLMKDEELRRTIGSSARRTVQESFSLDSVAHRYLNAYRSLLDEKT